MPGTEGNDAVASARTWARENPGKATVVTDHIESFTIAIPRRG